jgi:ribosomal protein L7/L12
MDTQQLVDTISKLSLMDAAALVKALEEKLGVSAAPVAVAVALAAAAYPGVAALLPCIAIVAAAAGVGALIGGGAGGVMEFAFNKTRELLGKGKAAKS